MNVEKLLAWAARAIETATQEVLRSKQLLLRIRIQNDFSLDPFGRSKPKPPPERCPWCGRVNCKAHDDVERLWKGLGWDE